MNFISKALWTWDTTPDVPVVKKYSSGQATKTGLLPADLKSFVGVSLSYYCATTPEPVQDSQILQWIRWAEDSIESETGVLLCQTFVASAPANTPEQARAIGVDTQTDAGYQKQGFDYDLADAPYDFIFARAQDEGWMNYNLRYRPCTLVQYSPLATTGLKNASYIYPLLNEFFRVPSPWYIVDADFGFIRFVPSTNVQMLPLFAMQLAFMGFAESVPGGIWMQYTAGLTPNDYMSRYSFVKQLVLCVAAIQGLLTVQGTINMGVEESAITVDGLSYKSRYSKNGPYGPLIAGWEKQRDALLARMKNYVAGPMLITI